MRKPKEIIPRDILTEMEMLAVTSPAMRDILEKALVVYSLAGSPKFFADSVKLEAAQAAKALLAAKAMWASAKYAYEDDVLDEIQDELDSDIDDEGDIYFNDGKDDSDEINYTTGYTVQQAKLALAKNLKSITAMKAKIKEKL